ncbi:PEP-CTERM sorting domain-containing protein [Cellvibrio sp.]|uniref:PEP-CTERM sorting domain-containing protein n=1 Tax=Cellvibrio sp. TaxID=1965322 RepID=UPI003F4B11FD
MKKFFIGLCALGLSLSLNANAISIDLVANKSVVSVGDSLEVAVRISGLNDANAPSLGVYDVNFQFDNSLFTFDSISWGDSAQGNQLDLSGFGSLQDSSSGSGWLNLFELSFDDALDLNVLQSGEFTLFSILLNTVAAGTGNFSLVANSLGDAYGDNLVADQINGTQVTAGAVSVPEPSSVLLLLVGILAIGMLRVKSAQRR